MLQRCDMLKGKVNEDRVLYSLRHTYASRRRYDGVSIGQLATVMGTSSELLQSVYSHFASTDNPNLFSGHIKRAQQKEGAAAKQQMSDLLAQNDKLFKMVEKLTEAQRVKG